MFSRICSGEKLYIVQENLFRREGIYCSVESVQERRSIFFSRICSGENEYIVQERRNILFSRICSEEKEYIFQ